MPTLEKPGRRECDTRRQAVHAAQGGDDTPALPQPPRCARIAPGHPWTPLPRGGGRGRGCGAAGGTGSRTTCSSPCRLRLLPSSPPRSGGLPPLAPPPSSSPRLLRAGADLNRLAGSQELIILMQCKMECA